MDFLPLDVQGIVVSYFDRTEDMLNVNFLIRELLPTEKEYIHKIWILSTRFTVEKTMVMGNEVTMWNMNGKKHREQKNTYGSTLPAVVFANGAQEWWRNGKLHRDADEKGLILPASIYPHGSGENECEWWIDGKFLGECSCHKDTYHQCELDGNKRSNHIF